MDFGTGWGRIIHAFMRHFELKNIFGAEPDAVLCATARSLNNYVTFLNSNWLPPLIFHDNSMDYITAYSVFTHLPEELFLQWMSEFARILAPGGLVCFTIIGDRLLEDLVREAVSRREDIHFWHKILIDNLGNPSEARTDLRDRGFRFLRTHQGNNYGDTFITPEYIENKLGNLFRITYSNSKELAQDFICVQKR